MDLFLVFRTRTSWGTPIHLGAVVNAPGSDAEARLSPDGQTLYFSSERKVPIHLPLTREAAQANLERIAAWDNGQYNIWMVSLRPWLERKPSDGR
jgi:Tol biopolymer transport system component